MTLLHTPSPHPVPHDTTPLQHLETHCFIETSWSTKQKSYMKRCLLIVARDLKRKIKKGNKGEKDGGSVCGRVITTHPWCCVELQWCVFVRASLPPGVLGGRWCYRVPCLSEVIHVFANRSCKGGEGGGRATAHRRRVGEGNGGVWWPSRRDGERAASSF